MKRNKDLAILSREHLPALVMAYRLVHGRSSNPAEPWPSDPAEQRQALLNFVRPDLERHFAAEERYLLPLQNQLRDPGPSHRVKAEHRQFWDLLAVIESAGCDDLPPLLRELGQLLETHVRFEERVWFEQLQAELSPDTLSEQGRLMAAFLQAD